MKIHQTEDREQREFGFGILQCLSKDYSSEWEERGGVEHLQSYIIL